MEQITGYPTKELYQKVYDTVEGYGEASLNHCPGIRLYPYYKGFLSQFKGETVDYFRKLRIKAQGIDWIEPKNKFCKKGNITLTGKYKKYKVATCFDVIEHLTNPMVVGLFKNMMQCEYQIMTIANTPSYVELEGQKVDLHVNKKPFNKWRTILTNYFDILEEIQVRDYQHLYICQKKHSAKEYVEFIKTKLEKNHYFVIKKTRPEEKLKVSEEGHWFYPVTDFVYDQAYFDKYTKMKGAL